VPSYKVALLRGGTPCASGSEVWRVEHLGLHTVCHLGGRGLSGTVRRTAGAWRGWGALRERWQRTSVTWLPC